MNIYSFKEITHICSILKEKKSHGVLGIFKAHRSLTLNVCKIFFFNLDLVKNSCTLSGFKKLTHELHFYVPNNRKWSSEKS